MRLTRKICDKHGYHLIDEGGSGNELIVGMGRESMGQAFDGLNDHESSPLQGCMLNFREQTEEAGYRLGGPAFGLSSAWWTRSGKGVSSSRMCCRRGRPECTSDIPVT